MNKKITIYELLGLIKDGKAPKLVKYYNYIWEYKKQFDDYFNDEEYLIENGFDSWNNVKDFLEEKVEILEEDKPIIESISIIGKDIHKLENLGIYNIIEDIEAKLNEVIEFLNRKEDK